MENLLLLKNPHIISLLIYLVILSMGLVKIIDFLIKFLAKKMTSNKSDPLLDMISKIEEEVHDLHDLHQKYDEDGTPLWYVPRELLEIQKEILERQQRIIFILESIEEKVGNDE